MTTLLLLLACKGGQYIVDTGEPPDDSSVTADDSTAPDDTGEPVDDTGEPTDDTGEPVDDTGDTGNPDGCDRDVVDEVLAGTRSAEDALLTVALSDGWPITCGDGVYLFAALDEGQPGLSVAGDHNAWEPEAMTRQMGLFLYEAEIAAPEGSLYKLVARGDYEADPWARAYAYDSFGEYSLVRGGGEHLERWPEQAWGPLAPRTVRVWVPAGDVTHQLYVHDGQNLFDPGAIWGGWHLDEALGPHTMVVGIDNTADRMDEYTHVPDDIGAVVGGAGDDYAELLLQQVRPLVEQEYGAAPVVGTMGSSLGGLISLHLVFRDPDQYDFAASLSGTVGWGSIGLHNETLIERYAAAGPFGVPIYLDSGGGPGSGCVDSDNDGIEDDSPNSSDNYCENRQMADAMAAAGWTWEQDLWHWWEEGAPHNEAAWAARVALPVEIFEGL
ncbi:MAG: hypothetical protein H6740_24620 [Alphaproteobacteria bacterium]|nr:hypothetical protein [Alphaproteobacteria bacterium]